MNKTEIDRLLHRCQAWILFRTLANALFDPYRPELHYMRGPGPKWRVKHRPRGETAVGPSRSLPSQRGSGGSQKLRVGGGAFAKSWRREVP
jgi:hypothetical protein